MRARATLIVVFAAAALAVAGCGDDSDGNGGGDAGGSGASAGTVKLSATEFKFTPADPTVDKAGKVTFEVSNDGQTVHALEVEGPDGEKETDNIDPGQSATLEVDLGEPGTYELYCPVGNHRQMGMTGEITVATGGGGSSSGETTEPSEEESGGGGSSRGY